MFSQELYSNAPTDSLNTDTVKVSKPRHSPTKAALLSAFIPGAGQVYNKKYWKLPIFYSMLGGVGVWVGINIKNIKGFTKAYRLEIDDNPLTQGTYRGFYGDQLRIKRDQVKTSLDLSIIVLSVCYALSIIDATVDAHMFDYSINDDLSVSLSPSVEYLQVFAGKDIPVFGLKTCLSFSKVE